MVHCYTKRLERCFFLVFVVMTAWHVACIRFANNALTTVTVQYCCNISCLRKVFCYLVSSRYFSKIGYVVHHRPY